jgi:hypothetical protein
MIQTCEPSYPVLLPGIRSECDPCGHILVLLSDQTSRVAVDDLVLGLPADQALFYFDREYRPQNPEGFTGCGAYAVAYWNLAGMVRFYANHGWTSEVAPVEPRALADDLYRCRGFNASPAAGECAMILPHQQRTRPPAIPSHLGNRPPDDPHLRNLGRTT